MKKDAPTLVQVLELRAVNGLTTPPDLFFKLRNSADSEKLIIFKDQLNRAIGYVAWANINKESTLRFLKKMTSPTYPYEWTEGGISLVIDALIQKNASSDGICQLKQFMLSQRAILFSRRGRPKLYRRRRNSFHHWKIHK